MSRRQLLVLFTMVTCGLLASAPAAQAQPLGVFRWQLLPYCNVLTVAVVQGGGQYHVDGTDDLCGGSRKASVVGLAFPNPDGSIGFGLTTVTAPGGAPIHIDAVISVASVSGTWRDSGGNAGSFLFTPGAGQPGSPRRVPAGGIAPGSITASHLAPGAIGASQLGPNSVSSSQIVNGSVTTADLQAAPRVAFVAGEQASGLDHDMTVLPAHALMRAVTITAPSGGTVAVHVSGYIEFFTAGRDHATCSITTALSVDQTHAIAAAEDGGRSVLAMPFAGVRAFVIPAGPFTANLYCQADAGIVTINDTSMTAVFVPQ